MNKGEIFISLYAEHRDGCDDTRSCMCRPGTEMHY